MLCGFNIFGLSFADFNGDGKIDVLSQSNFVPGLQAAEPNNLNVMLNNGDGTFGPVKAVDTCVDRKVSDMTLPRLRT